MYLRGPARWMGVFVALMLSLAVVRVLEHSGKATAQGPIIVSSGTTILQGTYIFCFDTGTECMVGGDVWWDQKTATARQMVPQGSAQLVNLGAVNFDALSPANLQALHYGTSPIDGNADSTNQLVANDVFAVLTNGGNYAKVQVITYGYNLQIQWVTYASQQPSPSSIGLSANSGQLGSTVVVTATGYLPNELITISLQYGGTSDLAGTQVPGTGQTFTADGNGALTATYTIESSTAGVLLSGDYDVSVVGGMSGIKNTLPYTIISPPTSSPASTYTPTATLPTPTATDTPLPLTATLTPAAPTTTATPSSLTTTATPASPTATVTPSSPTTTATPAAATTSATPASATTTATPASPTTTATIAAPTTTTPTSTPTVVAATIAPKLSSASHFTNFVPSRNGFGFGNAGATGSTILTTDMFMHEFGLTSLSPLDIFVYNVIYKNVGAGGLSYGYAVASALHYLHLPQPAAGPYTLNVTGNLADKQPADAANSGATASTILNTIAFYHGTQTAAQAQQQASTDRTSYSVGDLLARIESAIDAGQPAVLDISGTIQTLGTQGHSLLAFAYSTNATDPQHPSAPAVLVSVYDPSYPKVDDQAVTFWQDTAGQWHWYYTLFAVYLPYQNSPVTWSGPDGGNTNLDVPSLQLATQQGTEPTIGSQQATYLEFENTGALTIADSQGNTASIATVGASPQGTIPGLLAVAPQDAANVHGSGALYIPETSAFTITQSLADTTTSAASLSLVGSNGQVQIALSGAASGQALTVAVDPTFHDLHFGVPGGGTMTGTLSVTFVQVMANGSLSYTLTGLPADVREVQLAPDVQSVMVQAGATAGTYCLAVMSTSTPGAGQAAGKTSTLPGLAVAAASSSKAPVITIYAGLALAAGASQVAKPGLGGAPATVVTTFAAGSPHPPATQHLQPSHTLAFDGGGPVAPGTKIAVHAPAGTFSPNEKFALFVAGTLPSQPTRQAAADGSFSGTFLVPAAAASGSFVIRTGGSAPASGILQIVKSTVQRVRIVGTPPPLVIHNNRRTVVGGRSTACTLAGNMHGKFQAGCETISSILYTAGVRGATVLYVLTYANGTKQTFKGTADRHGNALHPFNVKYLPPPGSKHGQPSTVAYIAVSVKLKNGTTLGPVTTRFSVIR